MHLSVCEAPSTSVFNQVGGSTPKRKGQPTPVTDALADDIIQHVSSHQEFHQKLVYVTVYAETNHMSEKCTLCK